MKVTTNAILSSITKIMFTAVFALFSLNSFAANNLTEMFNESMVDGKLIYRYTNLSIAQGVKDASDSAVGGILSVKTGSFNGISFGVTFGTANDMLSNDDDNSYGLLQQNSDGNHLSYDTMKEYYIQGELFKTTLKYGAQQIHTPWANNDDYPFFLPITYRGLSVINNSLSNTEIHGYYLTDISMWNDDDFNSISKNINAAADNEPLLIGGIKYSLPSKAMILDTEIWGYHMDNFINMNYVKTRIGKNLGSWTVYLEPSYVTQKSTGDEIGGNFDTNQYGAMLGAEGYGLYMNAYYAKTGDDNLFRGWGNSAIVPSQFLVSERAEETAYMVYLGYAFDNIGIPGLYAAVSYAGFDAPDSGANYADDVTEINYNIMYDFNDKVLGGTLKGLHLETRYAQINYDNEPDMTELQILTTYSFSFGGEKK